jgi:hypothetical protein
MLSSAANTLNNTDPLNQIKTIDDRLTHMSNTYEGCDWCCGGGDQEWDQLHKDRKELVEHLTKTTRGLAAYTLYTLQNPEAWDQVTNCMNPNGVEVCNLWDLLKAMEVKKYTL